MFSVNILKLKNYKNNKVLSEYEIKLIHLRLHAMCRVVRYIFA